MNIHESRMSIFVRNHILYRFQLFGGQSKHINMSA